MSTSTHLTFCSNIFKGEILNLSSRYIVLSLRSDFSKLLNHTSSFNPSMMYKYTFLTATVFLEIFSSNLTSVFLNWNLVFSSCQVSEGFMNRPVSHVLCGPLWRASVSSKCWASQNCWLSSENTERQKIIHPQIYWWSVSDNTAASWKLFVLFSSSSSVGCPCLMASTDLWRWKMRQSDASA